MTPYNTLVKAIQAANPQLLELSFGCEIEIIDEHLRNDKLVDHLTILGDTTDKNVFLALHKHGTTHLKWREITEFCKILGHPITLEHVLRAIVEAQGIENNIVVDSEGQFFSYNGEGEPTIISPTNVWWQLGKPLSNQRQEVIDFLSEIL